MKKLSYYIKQHIPGYILAIISMICAIALDMLSPQLTRRIIDDVILGNQISRLTGLLLGIVGIGVGRCVFGYCKEFVFDLIGSEIASSMRKDLFAHIQSLSASFFDKNNTGELMARVKDDIDRIWNAVSYVSMLLIEVVFHTGIILFCMYSMNVRLSILPTITMVICGCLAVWMERKLNTIYEDISEENAKLNTVAEENLAGVRTVKAFAREKFEIKKFLSHNERYYDLNMRQSIVFIRYYPFFQVITKLLPLVMLAMGGKMVIDGAITLGTLGAFVEYSTNIVWPMEMLGWLSNDFSAGIASTKKIRKIYQVQPDITTPVNPVSLPKVEGHIEFENVSFHKEDGYEILSDISFDLKPGHTLGIMGTTGAGKTSLIQLLQRMYDTTEGSIRLDGVDIRELSLKQLRSNISLVMQDVFLFSDTIGENVKLGKKNAIDPNVISRALMDADASSFVEAMEDHTETVIGERGVGLSGGQKQRISIARALAKERPILVLDDSTSALDMETEQQIQQRLKTLNNTTKIIIAHRISAVRDADEILILEQGKVKERGTHQELLEKKGLYYLTYQTQYGAYVKKEVE